MRRFLWSLVVLLTPAPVSATGPIRVAPDGAPNCNYVITIPPAESVTGSIDGSGVLHLVVGAYVRVPVASSVSASGNDVRVEIASSGVNETYCTVPLRVTNGPSRPVDVTVTLRRGARRPTTTAKTTVR